MTVAEKVTITVPLEMDADNLWQMIFGSEFETWEWWYAYTNFQGGDWEHHCLAEVYHYLDEDNGEVIPFQLTIDHIVAAITALIQQGNIGVTNALINEDFDADAADMVIQQACFGEVVYG